jgi:hypothetical protein
VRSRSGSTPYRRFEHLGTRSRGSRTRSGAPAAASCRVTDPCWLARPTLERHRVLRKAACDWRATTEQRSCRGPELRLGDRTGRRRKGAYRRSRAPHSIRPSHRRSLRAKTRSVPHLGRLWAVSADATTLNNEIQRRPTTSIAAGQRQSRACDQEDCLTSRKMSSISMR